MEQNAQINTFTGGMNMDKDISLLSDNEYRYAENIRLLADKNSSTGALQNIEHIRQYYTNIPEDETILGVATTRWYYNNSLQECGVVLTKKSINDKTYNNLYVVGGFDSIYPYRISVARGYFGLDNKVNIVCNYESTTISKVYITDGNSTIKMFNIQDTIVDEVTDSTYFDLLPGATLSPFKLVELVSGILPAGMVQYCYQLFKIHGSQTVTSPLSAKIPITLTSINSKTTNGSQQDTTTDKGCKLKATVFNDGRFDRLRIIRIVYTDSTSNPKIQIIDETDVITNNSGITTFEYTDDGSSFLSELTVEEFNDLIPFEFKARAIEKKDNLLFAANVEEITWDVDYDARAYRANKKGQVRLESSYGQPIVTTLESIVNGQYIIPEEHDCINPMNDELLYPEKESDDDYSWDTTNNRLGGAGPNVSYRFVYTRMIESEQELTEFGCKYNMELNVSKNKDNATVIYDYDNDSMVVAILNSNGISTINNYSDPNYVSNYLGYQRDETYRFGIIFYNNKNIPSPVHWIGDIRFPSPDYDNLLNYAAFYQDERELRSKPIGLYFTVNNLPKDVEAYEIVRCRRTFSDRTVVTQGLLNKTVNFRGWKEYPDFDSTVSIGDIDRRPYVIPTYSEKPAFAEIVTSGFMYQGASVGKDPVDTAGVFDFVSADVCFNKTQNIVESGMYIVPLYVCLSEIDSTGIYSIAEPSKQAIVTAVAPSELKGIDEEDMIIKYKTCFGQALVSDETETQGDYVFVDGYKNDAGKLISSGVFKFYRFYDKKIATSDYQSSKRSARIIEDAKIATNIPPAIASGIADVKNNYIDYVGNYAYTNWSIGTGHGPHGVSTVIFSPQMYSSLDDGFSYTGVNKKNVLSNGCGLIVNIKKRTSQYGGNTFAGRQSSIYNISCVYVNNSFENYKTPLCFNGDTYLGVLDYAHTLLYNLNSFNEGSFDKRYVQVYVPLESSVNVYYRADKHFAQETQLSGVEGKGGVANIMYMTEPGQLSSTYVQSIPMYTYNSAYSNTYGSKNYVAKSLYAKDNSINLNRITCSELKTNNEIIDSWSKFKFANYLDVDGKYGKITNLKNFNNNLYYFQDEAVGIASVNERSLITDNNVSTLTLGTGAILSRYDYVVVTNGSSIVNDKSIVNSSSTMYWFDYDKNTLCALNNNFIELSKIKGAQTYLNQLYKDYKKDCVAFYDKKYNEVWFRFFDRSLIFNEQLNAFTSFYTHNPDQVFSFSDKSVTIKNNNFYYLHNEYQTNSEIKEERIANVKLIVNKDATNTKVFDNVSFTGDLIDEENDNPHIITQVKFLTKNQETDYINYNSIEKREDNYRFYIPREYIQQNETDDTIVSYAGRMRGKYLICDYTFDCNEDREIKIPYIKTTYRYSML